jgi:hypothetical protein
MVHVAQVLGGLRFGSERAPNKRLRLIGRKRGSVLADRCKASRQKQEERNKAAH